MSTIINERGIGKQEEVDKPNIPEDEFSIENYRNKILTDKEEWDNVFYPKRISIEAVETIITRKRGKGEAKLHYSGSKDNYSGPIYDPCYNHVHVWKNHKCIPNLIGPQKQNVAFIQFTDLKPGLYCLICHCFKKNTTMKWRPEPDANNVVGTGIYQTGKQYSPKDFQKEVKIFPKIEEKPFIIEEKNISISKKWDKLMKRVFYSMNNKKIVYPISKYKSIIMWPWQMTKYQKFNYNNPEYRNSNIFVKLDMEKFQNDYVYIT